jgi:hypothetical protein
MFLDQLAPALPFFFIILVMALSMPLENSFTCRGPPFDWYAFLSGE